MASDNIIFQDSRTKYADLGNGLSMYLNELNTNLGVKGLKEAFAPEGRISDVLTSLENRQNEINQSELSSKDNSELEEIKFLQNRINELSSVLNKTPTSFTLTKSLDEFTARIEAHNPDLSQGFFSTLVSFISQIFKEKSIDSLNLANFYLKEKTDSLAAGNSKEGISNDKEKGIDDLQPPLASVSPNLSNSKLILEENEVPVTPPIAQAPKLSPLDITLDYVPIAPPLAQPLAQPLASIPDAPPLNLSASVTTPPPLKSNISPSSGDKAPVPKLPLNNDLLSEIRAKGANKSKEVSLDHPDYKVVTNYSLDGLSAKEQQNVLYSAKINKDKKLVAELLTHQSDFKTGRMDEWDADIMEKRVTFSPDDITKVDKAVEETLIRIAKPQEFLESKEKEQNTTTIKEQETSKSDDNDIQNLAQNVPAAPQLTDLVAPPVASPMEVPQAPPMAEFEVPIKSTSSSKSSRIIAPSPVDRSSFLEEIKAGKTTIKPKAKGQSLNSDGFTYINSKEKVTPKIDSEISNLLLEGLNARRSGVEPDSLKTEIKDKFSNLPQKEQQLNYLYSAVIDGDKKKIEAIVDYVEKRDIFNKDDMAKVALAAQNKLANIEVPRKNMIEAGVTSLASKAGLEGINSQERGK